MPAVAACSRGAGASSRTRGTAKQGARDARHNCKAESGRAHRESAAARPSVQRVITEPPAECHTTVNRCSLMSIDARIRLKKRQIASKSRRGCSKSHVVDRLWLDRL